ncbi:MAG TPA: hypothetical protein VFS75_01395 [Candidatus Paceibacterota bacterium]|nr:hypothetical protein [Candidatus Paceibacterota bacterium]
MSDSYSAGKAAEEAAKIKASRCNKSPNGAHAFEKRGSGPSRWEECRHCKTPIYYK